METKEEETFITSVRKFLGLATSNEEGAIERYLLFVLIFQKYFLLLIKMSLMYLIT